MLENLELEREGKDIKCWKEGSRKSGSPSKLAGETRVWVNVRKSSCCPTWAFLHLLWPSLGKNAEKR